AGRVLATPVVSEVNVPGYVRAAMDGYAVQAADAANSRLVIGESLPAKPFSRSVQPGEAVRIMTGAPVPSGADAVVPFEAAQENAGYVSIPAGIAAGRNVGRIGEDVAMGIEVLPAGRVLRPQDLGLLASIGTATVPVFRRPRVAILVTGDELLPPGSRP